MKQILTFVLNINDFRQSLRDGDQKFVSVNEQGKVQLNIEKIKVKSKMEKTLTLCLCTNEQELFLECQ